jgi:hypothetical protein
LYQCEHCGNDHLISPTEIDGYSVVERYDGKFWVKGDKHALRVSQVPSPEGTTLQDQDDVVIWFKFNILLQAVDELTQEHGHAGDATRQLRVVTAEVIRRSMFSRRLKNEETTPELLFGWYMVLKQFIEGANAGKWEHQENAQTEYVLVIKEIKGRGHAMPNQSVKLKPLDLVGEAVKPKRIGE